MDQFNPTRTRRLQTIVRSLTLVVAVSFVRPVQVHAQSADSKRGGWVDIALGYGSIHAPSDTSGVAGISMAIHFCSVSVYRVPTCTLA